MTPEEVRRAKQTASNLAPKKVREEMLALVSEVEQFNKQIIRAVAPNDKEKRMSGYVNDTDHAVLDAEWHTAFDALNQTGLDADANHPIAAMYRAASDAVNHANRSRDYRIATGQSTKGVEAMKFYRLDVDEYIGIDGENVRYYTPDSVTTIPLANRPSWVDENGDLAEHETTN